MTMFDELDLAVLTVLSVFLLPDYALEITVITSVWLLVIRFIEVLGEKK